MGWELETKIIIIRPLFDKYTAWICDLNELIMSGETTIKALESIIRRLNHAAYVIPLSHHFLNRLRSRLERMCPTHPNQTFCLTMDEIKAAELQVTFLAQARTGTSLNCLTLRQPWRVGISDSCPFGLGGFTWSRRAWRLMVPKNSPLHGDCIANNFLEFLAMVITIWLVLLECEEVG